MGNSDIKIESNFEPKSNFEPNGYIYYHGFQTITGDNVETGYELFIGNKLKYIPLNKNKIEDDYIYLTNINQQKFEGSPTGLSVVTTYSTFVENLIKMAPNDVQNKLIIDPERFQFLSIILLKSLGDMLQEFNGILKWGGYSSPSPSNIDIEPWNSEGDALRCVLSNDQPSASRIILYKYIFPREYLNNKGYGGYCHYHQSGNKEKTYTIIPFSQRSTATTPLLKSESSTDTDPVSKKAKGITRKFIKKPKSLLKISRKKNVLKKIKNILKQKKSRIKSQKKEKKNKQDKQEKKYTRRYNVKQIKQNKSQKKIRKTNKIKSKN